MATATLQLRQRGNLDRQIELLLPIVLKYELANPTLSNTS